MSRRDLKLALADVQLAVDLTSDPGGRPKPERRPLHVLCVGARGVVLSLLGKATAPADLDPAIAALARSRDAAGFGNYYVLFLAVRGECFLKANNLPEAERYFGWAISSTDTRSSSFRGDRTWKNILGECHEQRAELMRRRGQFRQAMEEYDKAIALGDDLLVSRGWWEFSGLCRRANARFDAREYEDCILDFHRCIYFHCSVYETTRRSSDLGQILECLLRRGIACSESGESASAIKDFERGISVIEQAGKEGEWRPHLSAILNNLAFALGRSKDGAGMRRAIALATKACELTDWKEPEVLDTLAEVHAHTGDFELAVKYQEMAMASLKPSDEERRARYAKKIEDFRTKARAK